MSDAHINKVIFVEIATEGGPKDLLCNHWENLYAGTQLYTSMPTLDVAPSTTTGSADSKECIISGLLPTTEVIAGLRSHRKYAKVTVTVFYGDLDASTSLVSNIFYLYTGTLFQAYPRLITNALALECRELKYYTDIVAGVSCTEQCYAPYFGDPKICQKARTTRNFKILSVSLNTVTVENTVTDLDFSFNQGEIFLNGVLLGIRYWESGSTFETHSPPPADWVGKTAKFTFGCDKSKETCENIHNNIIRFFGCGLGMVDYDPKSSIA